MSILELVAVLFGILYLIFITFHRRIGWIFGCLSSTIFIYLCIQQGLYIQGSLQVAYVILGVVGYNNWNNQSELTISRISLKYHLIIIFIGLIAGLSIGKFMSMTNQQLPYLDATISVFSILATYLATKSILENWIYWIVVNAVSIILFSAQGLIFTSVLYLLYGFGSVYGYYNWKGMLAEKRDNQDLLD